MGYAAALAWILFLIIALISFVVLRTSKSWVYYEGG
jgi:multiple sugar transport system permease protein